MVKQHLQFMHSGMHPWNKSRPGADNRRPAPTEVPDWPSDEGRELVVAVMTASQPLLKEIWDNPDDAEYDQL